MRAENIKSITELKNELAAEREESHKSITELKGELAAEREESHKSITELKKELAAEREENIKSITELKYDLAAERAAREEKAKEVAALTERLSQAEEILSQQKEETCKILEISCQSTANIDALDETRVLRKQMENLVTALTTQSAQAEKTRVRQMEETRKVWEAIYVTSEQRTTKSDARIILAHKNTTKLKVDKTDEPLTDCGLLHLPFLTSLKCLEISHCVPNAALRHLYTMTWPEELKLESGCFDDSEFSGISNLAALHRLELINTGVSENGLAHLTCLGSLKVLILSRGNFVSTGGMVHVGKLTWLEELKLDGFNNSVVWGITNLRGLRRLELIHSGVSNDGLAHLTCLGSLKVLVLAPGNNISSAGMTHVGELTTLEALDISASHSMNEGLADLAPLSKLTWLALPEHMTYEGMRHLLCLKSLKTVWLRTSLYSSPQHIIGHLKTLPCLETIGVRDSQTENLVMGCLPPNVNVTVITSQSEFYPA
ncbi:unnamed protein product [Closterium sp. Yama58-4]|nr:unnamed protein product [Closterium sp. Yama58-4]